MADQQQTVPPPVVLVGLTQAECAFVLGRLDPNGAAPATCALYAKMAGAWLELRARDAVESAAAQVLVPDARSRWHGVVAPHQTGDTSGEETDQ